MKYILTGGAGFIGSHLSDGLIELGHKVICIDDLSSGLKSNLSNSQDLIFINKKIQDLNSSDLEEEYDGIFHLAAQASIPVSIEQYYKSSSNNLLGNLKVWDLAKKLDIPVVYASSSAVYGDQPLGNDELDKYDILSPYAQDKLTMESYANMCWRVYNTPSIGLRFFNVFGPRQDPSNPYSGVISIFIDRLMQNKSVTVNGGYQTRDFIYVKDVIDVAIQSMNLLFEKKINDIFNVGTGNSITINQLLDIITDIMKVKPKISRKELPVGDPEKSNGTYDKLKTHLNIIPNDFVKLENGLEKTIEFIRKDQST